MGTHGGRANELGSLHRSGFAALLAAYGLRGLPLPFLEGESSGAFISSLQFETNDAVDDVRCVMNDGSYVVFQAKRSCGNDKNLTATVQQWVEQLPSLREGDKVGLVVRNAKGPVKNLGESLKSYRSDFQGILTNSIESPIEAVRNNFPQDLPHIEADKLLRAAYCVECAADKPGDSHFDVIVALLDSVVVANGFGTVAAKILQRNFQQGAASGLGSSVKDWITWLQEGGLTPEANPVGPPGPKVAAEAQALANYLQAWRSHADKIQYSLLAEDLPTLHVDGLAQSFKVLAPASETDTRKSKTLLAVSRRWRRFFLVGLPGSGKSTALRQVAANWASYADAPAPIFVPLKRVAERITEPSGLNIELLIELAVENSEPRERSSLKSALLKAATNGDVAIFLDGLDECRNRTGSVSFGIEEVLQKLHPNVSVVITGRNNSTAAAKKLNLPEVRLCEPSLLDATMKSLLKMVAQVRVSPEQREAWLGSKLVSIEDSKRKNGDIWQIPLLATMLTLLTASRDSASLPSSRARILYEIVCDSVRKWELQRQPIQPPGGWSSSLDAPYLLDGFAVIGHSISGAEATSSEVVEKALEAMLKERWGRSVGEAEAIAPDIRWFWDEHVGVFLAQNNGETTEARSRQFVEIAEAIWVSQQDDAQVTTWVQRAISDEDMRETLVLAAGLSAKVSDILLNAVQEHHDIQVKSRGLLWLLEAQQAEPTLPFSRIETLVALSCSLFGNTACLTDSSQNTADATRPEKIKALGRRGLRRLKIEGPGWKHIACLAQIAIPESSRIIRDRALAALPISGYKRDVVNALVALADAAHDSQSLTREQAESVRTLLNSEIEEPRHDYKQVSRRRFSIDSNQDPLLTGHHEASLLSLHHLDALGETVLPHLKIVAERGPSSDYPRFATALRAKGIEMKSPWPSRVMEKFISNFGEDDYWGGILQPIAAMGESTQNPVELDREARWRMPDLVDLLETLGIGEIGIQDYRNAVNSDAEILPAWLVSLSGICAIDVSTCAQQAEVVLEDEEGTRSYDYDFLFTSIDDHSPTWQQADFKDLETLASGLWATSDWIAQVSYWALCNLADARSLPMLDRVMSEGSPTRKKLATIAWCISSGDPADACQKAFLKSDPAIRAGAAALTRFSRNSSAMMKSVRADARVDDDMTVRWCATRDENLALAGRFWSCYECSTLNARDLLDCPECSTGSRPFG